MQSNVTITGYLGRTPEVRETPSGKRVASVRIAINDRRLGDEARWVAVDQWDDAADRAAKYLVRGQHVTAEGLLDAEIYTDRNGNAQLAWRLRRGYIEYGPKPLDNDSPNGTGEEPAQSGTRQSTPARQTATAAA